MPIRTSGFFPTIWAMLVLIRKDALFILMQQPNTLGDGMTLATLSMTVWTNPESASNSVCAFIPKCHCLLLLIWCILGARSSLLLVMEVGAAIRVVSTQYRA